MSIQRPWPDLAYRAKLEAFKQRQEMMRAFTAAQHQATLEHYKTCEKCRGELKAQRQVGKTLPPEVLAAIGEAAN